MSSAAVAVEQAGERLNRIGDLHPQSISVETDRRQAFSVSLDDHCVVLGVADTEPEAYYLPPDEVRSLIEALWTALGWLAEEDAAGADFTATLDCQKIEELELELLEAERRVAEIEARRG